MLPYLINLFMFLKWGCVPGRGRSFIKWPPYHSVAVSSIHAADSVPRQYKKRKKRTGKMWASEEGGPPEVTLETSMGPFTVEVFLSSPKSPFSSPSLLFLSFMINLSNLFSHSSTTNTPPKPAEISSSSLEGAITTTSNSTESSRYSHPFAYFALYS